MAGSVGRVLAAALVLGLGLGPVGGCAPRAADPALPAAQPEIRGNSALAPYLAGRFAHAHGDTRAAASYYLLALDRDPENVELLQRAFTLLIAEGRVDEAAPLAARIQSFDADAPMPLIVLGVRAAREGRFAEAEKHFAALPHKGVNGFLGPLLSAWSRAGQGRTDAALEALAPLTKTPALAPIHEYHAGLIDDLAGRAEAAEKHYLAALSGNQANLRAIEAAGAFFQRSGRIDRARELYTHHIGQQGETLPFDGEGRLALGTGLPRPVSTIQAGLAEALFDTATLTRQGNALDLAMVFSRLTLELAPELPLAHLLLGDVLAAQGRPAEANEQYRALEANPAIGLFAGLRVAVNLDAMGDTDGALRHLRGLADKRPAELEPLMATGDMLRRHKRHGEAVKAYDEAVGRVGGKAEGRHWSVYFARGVAHERSGQWPRAEADFLKALELKGDQPDVLNYLGYSWVDQGVHLERGREMIEKAVKLRPNDGAIVDSLGWALYRMADYPAAVKALERAVELRPEDPTINDHLGDALYRVGRKGEAVFQWQRALTLDPDPDLVAPLKLKVETGALPPGAR